MADIEVTGLEQLLQQAGDLDISIRAGQLILSRKAPDGTLLELNGGDITELRNWSPKVFGDWLAGKITELSLGTAAQAAVATDEQTVAGAAGVLVTAEQVRTGYVKQVGSIAELSTLPSPFNGQEAIVTNTSDGASIFVYVTGNKAAQVLGDPDKKTWVAPDSEPTGVSGAWVSRDHKNRRIAAKGPNLVEKIMAKAAIRGMYCRTIDANKFAIGIGMSEELKSVVEYRFVYNADNLLLLRGVFSGVEDESTCVVNPSLFFGTFVTGAAPSSYTTQVGATFRATITGTSLRFRSTVDNRGGVWRVTMSNGMARDISTWSSTSKSKYEQVVFDGFEYGTYQVKFEFIGDDPFNEPSGGAGTSRGWIYYTPGSSTQQPVKFAKIGRINTSTEKEVISKDSIPDFAIIARPASASYASEWVPAHGSLSGVSINPVIRVLVDGVSSIFTSGTLPSSDYSFREISEFQMTQRFDATNPNGSDGTMWKHYVSHSISIRSPILTIQNRMVLQQETRLSQIYFGMLPSVPANMSRLILNDGTEITSFPSSVDVNEYHDWGVTSAAFVGTFAAGNFHAAACNVTSLRGNNSLTDSWQPEKAIRVNYRTDGITKVYWDGGADTVLPAGTVLRAEHQLAAISGGRFPEDGFSSI